MRARDLRMLTRRTLLGAGVALAGSRLAAATSTWPSRAVRIVVPFPPGGTADILARILADHFTTAFKQPFVVESRAGAGGQIGAFYVASSQPDGEVLCLSGNASHVLAPAFAAEPKYDGVNDFTHIAYLGGPPVGLLVHPSLGANTVAEFLSLVRNSPAGVDYTSSGVGTHGFIVGEEFSRREKLKLNHIPYKGGGIAMLDLVAGHVKVAMMTFSTAAEQVRAGTLKALAVTAAKRLPTYNTVPTFAELGFSDMVSSTWFALCGPKGLPEDIVAALNRETNAALTNVKHQLERDAVVTQAMTPRAVTEFITNETAHWAPLARQLRDSGIKLE